MHAPPNSAARSIVVCFLALAIASLLNAEGLRKKAQTQRPGLRRDIALSTTRPLVRVSRFFHLSTPRHELQALTGREGADRVDAEVHLSPPPEDVLPPAHAAKKPRVSTPKSKGDVRPAQPKFTAADPLKVWVGGDSLGQVPGDALVRASKSQTAIKVLAVESRLATGLANPALYNWYTRVREVISSVRPDVVVLSFGADDAHDYMAGVPTGRKIGPLGSASWNAEYRRRVDGVTREFNAAGIETIWLGLPIPDGRGFRRSFPVVNSILQSVTDAHPKTSGFVDTWAVLDSAHGKYTPYLRLHGQLTRVRLADGVHYTAAGGDLVVQAILGEIDRLYALDLSVNPSASPKPA